MNWQIFLGWRFVLVFLISCALLRQFLPDINDPIYHLRAFTSVGNAIALLILSGYATASSITKNPEGFYKRRFIRIYPLYLCAILVALLPFVFFGNYIEPLQDKHYPIVPPKIETFFAYLFLVPGFVGDVFWSNTFIWLVGILAVGYLFAPWLIRVNSKVILALIALSGLLYIVTPYVYYIWWEGKAQFSLAQLGQLWHQKDKLPYYPFLGYNLLFFLHAWTWLLGFFYFREQDKLSAKLVLLAGSLMLILNQDRTGMFSLVIYFVTCLVLIFGGKIKLPRVPGKICEYLGGIAYPFFLFHRPTYIFAYKLGITNSATLIFLALLVGMFFYYAVDIPVRSRMMPGKKIIAPQGE
ncbi:acyltransferase family protein [Microseira sp. BLCC-F43]|jgi:peptidoglycan/LPS O-acetylase OafA/YrhL|uniref:acyltransferase family protein n=1 Tax=Microseira sp. BLCC-F43 TaxID=3153602 RepID=UPI0035BACBB7